MVRVVDEIASIVAEGRIPSVSVHVRVHGRAVLDHTAGRARITPPARPVADPQAYDLASVTKPLCGATLASLHLARGTLRADDPVRRFVPAVDPAVTVAMLLTHASGLPAWSPLHAAIPADAWGTPEARSAVLAAAAATPLAHAPGTTHVYSDLGFLVLLQVLEALGGPVDRQLAEVLARAGFAPDLLRWGWPGAAATEDCPVRGRVVEGEVHDLNAAAMGGVSTHAGLFATARDLGSVADALLDAARGVRDDLPAPAWELRGPGTHRGGWDGISPGASSTGRWWPPDGVGHLGYTGTSLWLAPRQRVVVVVLTNRVHPTDEKSAIRAARPRIHDAVARALGWQL